MTTSTFHVLPVLDLLHQQVVRGVAGQRDNYRPVESCLLDGADPVGMARAFRDKLGLSRLYLADLDAILFRRPNRDVYRALAEEGFDLMIDAGLHTAAEADELLADGATAVVAGLETLDGPEALADLRTTYGAERVVFSLDLQCSRPLGNARWPAEPLQIAASAAAAGVERMIVLDLAQVGSGTGGATDLLCRSIREAFPETRLITGGGVRGAEDLRRLQELGVEGVLVASALHDGRLRRNELEALRTAR